jgi:vacuolar protein sorting-associated protein 13D
LNVYIFIGNDLDVSGSLGGFHILDVTPDAGRHYHIFSVGSEETKNLHCDSMLHSVMYKTAHESMLVNDTGNKALQISFIKGFQQSTTIEDFTLDTSQLSDNSGQKLTSVNVQIASMCYLHSPRLLNEVTQCVSEFTDFMKSVASSIKTAASEVAKGIMTKNPDMSVYGSTTGMDFTKSNLSINNDDEINEHCKGSHILLNAQLQTPVIVFPRSTDSSDVLVANLGHISVKNFDALSQDLDEEESAPTSTVRMFVEAKDMNLYSLNIDKHMELHKKFGTESIFDTSIYRNSDFGLPIVHDTTVEILLEHVQPEPIIINVDDTDDWCFNGEQHKSKSQNFHTKEICSFIDVTACIATPLNVELSQSVYEQILQSSDNLTYNENIHGNIATDQREKSKEQQDQKTSIKQAEPVSKTVGDQKPTKVVDKNTDSVVKVMFKVPILNIEMKGEFDEGYKGLVNINLQDFVLNMKKENSYSTEIQVHLKTLIMEDLLEDENSEHRFLLISKQVEDKNKPQEPKLFLSQSCPDSCIIAPIPVMPHSLPSSFHKDLDDKHDKGPDTHHWKQNRSFRITGIPKFEK